MPKDGRRSSLLGVGFAREEGIELNILGLSAGIDLNDLALRLPGIGRIPAPALL